MTSFLFLLFHALPKLYTIIYVGHGFNPLPFKGLCKVKAYEIERILRFILKN